MAQKEIYSFFRGYTLSNTASLSRDGLTHALESVKSLGNAQFSLLMTGGVKPSGFELTQGLVSLRLETPVPNKIALLSEARRAERPQIRPTDSFGEESVIVSEFLGLILCEGAEAVRCQ